MPANHNLADVLALGLLEVPCGARVRPEDLPGPSAMRRTRAHRAFRLTDGLWHYFRHTDAQKARQADEDFNKGMLAVGR